MSNLAFSPPSLPCPFSRQPVQLLPTDLIEPRQERKYFDSGDYALSKAGKASDSGMTNIGTEHPSADNIPHVSPLTQQLTNPGGSVSGEGAAYGYTSRDRQGSPPMLLPGAGMHRGSINGIPGGGLPGAGMHRGSINGIPGGGFPGPGMHRGSINGIPGGGLPGGMSRSPAKESSFLARTESMNQDTMDSEETKPSAGLEPSASPPAKQEGIPIRR